MKTLPLVKCTITTQNMDAVQHLIAKSRYITVDPEDSQKIIMDVTRDIDEWQNIEMLLDRDKTSAVFGQVSLTLNFVFAAREFLRTLFERHGMYAIADFNIFRRADRNNDYTLVKTLPLDFTAYKEYDNRVTLACTREDLIQMINSEGKTKYDIELDNTLLDSRLWNYHRLKLQMKGNYTIPENQKDITPHSSKFMPRINLDLAEVIPEAGNPDFKSQEYRTNPDSGYFFKAGNNNADIRLEADFRIEGIAGNRANPIERVHVIIKARDSHGTPRPVYTFPLPQSDFENNTDRPKFHGNVSLDFKHEVFVGEEVFLYIDCNNEVTEFEVSNFVHFKVTISDTFGSPSKIQVIDPQVLIQRYLDEMSGNPGYFTAEIQWKETEYRTMIVAAESIRGLPKANIHGAPNDFFDWMGVLGYEYECFNRKLVFKPRDEFFRQDVTALELKARELADLIVQADDTYAYTTVEIGYEKQDYDSTNGRCEANGTFCYTTGFIASRDNKLTLISPYRADSMGIEFLCQEQSKNKKDTKSDNDIFFVALVDYGAYYSEYKGIEIEDEDTGIKMFNAPFNPYFLVQRNASLIGINTNQIKFKSTDMSRTAKITGVGSIYTNHHLPERLFDPIEYNFAAGCEQEFPSQDLLNGLVYFDWRGKRMKGFIKEIRKNFAANTETTWILWAVK